VGDATAKRHGIIFDRGWRDEEAVHGQTAKGRAIARKRCASLALLCLLSFLIKRVCCRWAGVGRPQSGVPGLSHASGGGSR
jgi:hypothetical protein